MAFLSDSCTFHELTDDILAACQPFSCGNEDLDDFFAHDATRYAHFLMGKTYCFLLGSDPSKIVCALTISNDSIRIYDLPRSRRDHMKSLTHHEKPLRRYPGVLIGRLGVSRDFAVSSSNKTGCRFVIVDAVNEPQVIAFYEKNDFHSLFSSEEQEFLYTGGKKGQPVVLTTRLMYYDLLEMRK